jgi:DNA repair protein RadA/Sms
MPKTSTTYVCRECGGESLRWSGQCPHCRQWNTLEEFTVRPAASRHSARDFTKTASGRGSQAGVTGRSIPTPVTDVSEADAERLRLEWSELNRVLGGGFVVGSLTLIGGEPGVGKSTLLMHVSDQLARAGQRVLYATGEESARQVRMRAARLGALHPNLLLLAENDLESILEATTRDSLPGLLIVDSIQTVFDPAIDASPGSVTQVREAAGRLLQLAKATGVPVVLVGHVTKEGAIAGPRVLEHMVDTVLYLEGERRQEHRILRANKNRFGSTEEIGVFAMGEAGLEEVADPSAMLLAEASLNRPGTVAVPVMEGTRPLLVELQSLVAKVNGGFPRRTATGIDLNRLYMLLAVLEQRAGVVVSDKDVYVNVTGGIHIPETAADLGVVISVAGNLCRAGVGERTIVLGEIGLTGEVRRVTQMERRLQEAARRGFSRAIIPRLVPGQPRPPGLQVVEVRDVAQAIVETFGTRLADAGSNGRREDR